MEAAKSADVLVVLTEWNEFRALDLRSMREVMNGNVLVDLRNMFPEGSAEQAGFVYYAVGRPLTRLKARTGSLSMALA
jgi:UDPglucose 6-dehydrogenase